MPAHAEIVVGAPDGDILVGDPVSGVRKLHGFAVDARENAIRAFSLLLLQSVFAKLLVVEHILCFRRGEVNGGKGD